ncbi:MAG: AcrR family transcriptional regulator [Candidatus Azotimanducaceae bacterium]
MVNAPKRARTDAQKQTRRRIILNAAEAHLAEVGFESFSMVVLARMIDMAKGTLYLYFETRDHLLLALFCEKLEQCSVKFMTALPEAASDLEFVSIYYDTLFTDPVYLALVSRLESVIEHNVSTAELVSSKQMMLETINRMATSVSQRLSLSQPQAIDLIISCASLWLGTAQTDTGPKVDEQALPQDVKQMMQQFSARNLFITNAGRILNGIRTDVQ